MTEKGNIPDEDSSRWGAYMRAAQGGDGEAFEALLNEILPRVRSHVFAQLNGREHAEDVVQNVLLSIHRSRQTYNTTRPFKPWLNAVMRNAVIDALRARRNEWRHQEFEEEQVPGAVPTTDKSEEEISPEMQSALSELPDGQREAVELLHVKELSVREAADQSGATPGALKVRAHRGRARLREILTGQKS